MTAGVSTHQLLRFGAAGLACCLLAGGCSTAKYKASADKEVYKIILAKQKRALNTEAAFTIEQYSGDPLKDLPRRFQPLIKETAAAGVAQTAASGDAGGKPAGAQEPPAIISLPKAVLIGIQNSPDYQTAKETVYLSALSLTLSRYQWTPQLSELVTGGPNRSGRDEYWTASNTGGLSQALATGGVLTASLATNFLRYTTGAPSPTPTSLLTANLTQPLWAGAGQTIAQESLTQAERNVIYAVRTFARHHRTFALSVASSYYQLLEQRAFVQTEWSTYQSLRQSTLNMENLANAGRQPEFQVDQTRQAELSGKVSYLSAVESYYDSLDAFKVLIGLRTDANVDVDEDELTKLVAGGIMQPKLGEQEAVKLALAQRLDLKNQRDAVADAVREVNVAANGLDPNVSLVASASVPSQADKNRPYIMRFEQGTYGAGLDVNLPLAQKAQRNTYRQTLINLDAVRRTEVLLEDDIKRAVRKDWTTLQEREQSYAIQAISVRLAERRVAGTQLLVEAGRATANDMLLAQSSLHDAQEALATALVDHTTARLQLWSDVETLFVTPEGRLEESADANPAAI